MADPSYRLALCNEVLRGLPFAAQCAFAAKVGYDALEIAPFTLSPEPHRLSSARVAEIRGVAADHGLAITGLHWLLVAPEGLSINMPDAAVRKRTQDVIVALVDLCAALGGRVLVHGSPKQRSTSGDPAGAWDRARETFTIAAEAAGRAGVIYCIEPLSPHETDFLTSFDDAAAMARAIDHPALRTMIDTSAAALSERESVPALIARALPSGLVAHVHLNDRNRKGPGQGGDRFLPILEALRVHGYRGDLAVEPFVYEPDGPACAARAAGYIRGLMEVLA
jgi:D-psicose/D-tagatose/L-ribulose 3-epimerase